jgi:hypothetical protein
LIGVQRIASFLISTGTAICGGSAIAAVGPILNASDEEMAVSLGTVFVLNSIALLVFPAIGNALRLTQSQFGLWAALAIHDTSSVVGATAKFGAAALAVGTTVKLARALWIVPLSLVTASLTRSKARVQWPWFILFFCLAAVANTYIHAAQSLYPILAHLGVTGLTVTLYLMARDSPRRRCVRWARGRLCRACCYGPSSGSLLSNSFASAGFISKRALEHDYLLPSCALVFGRCLFPTASRHLMLGKAEPVR